MPGIKPHARGGGLEIFGWGCATGTLEPPLYEILPTLIFFRKYKKNAAKVFWEGKSKTREWGQKCGKMPNFISWGLWVWLHVIWDTINPRPTESSSLAFIGQIWDKIQPSTHFLVIFQVFEWLYLVISAWSKLTKHRYLVNLAVIFLFTRFLC